MTAPGTPPASTPAPAAAPAPGPLATAARYARLTWHLSAVSVHRLTEYRMDFLLGAGGLVLRVVCQVAVVGMVFRQTPRIAGWDYHEVLFLLGFSLLPRGLDRMFTDQLWVMARKLVQNGDFFRYLIRPVHPLFSLLSERFLYPDGFGELLTGAALTWYAADRLDLRLSAVQWLLLPLLVLCGTLVLASIKTLFASLAFWTTNSFPALYAANQLGDFSGYPLDLYHPSLRWLLTWLLPYAFTAYVPATYLLFGRTGMLPWLFVVTAGAVTLALVVWHRGVDRYEMTGS
ncbi:MULTISPECIES: ABC-2 family transporter protein [unclassified Streptomyces]|uniref:ABC-2 family transporter protein n=1 Tax=unclassified Streptomyces TaxID=2593676 RepID=UPI00136D2180|nr:ABC transporter permease [Streptomyces sp. SID6139]MYR22082.1 ABC transporter permease [Streptomyces sp. SID6137]